jgi:NAD(P)H-dependent flavin oxidoreductase YrpB (nitropropane dioxygenase family)
MGTRFLLTSDSQVPDAVKRYYLDADVNGTVVTSALDGVPQRLLVTPLLQAILAAGLRARATRTVRNTLAFRRVSGTSWVGLAQAGFALKRESGRPLGATLQAANTPMMIKTAMVDGRPEDGVMATGQVVGLIDRTPSCQEMIAEIVTTANDVLTRLQG